MICYVREKVSKIEKKLSAAKEDLSKLQSEVEQPETDEALAKRIQSDIVLLEQHLADSRRYARDIKKLEANMPKGILKEFILLLWLLTPSFL